MATSPMTSGFWRNCVLVLLINLLLDTEGTVLGSDTYMFMMLMALSTTLPAVLPAMGFQSFRRIHNFE